MQSLVRSNSSRTFYEVRFITDLALVLIKGSSEVSDGAGMKREDLEEIFRSRRLSLGRKPRAGYLASYIDLILSF